MKFYSTFTKLINEVENNDKKFRRFIVLESVYAYELFEEAFSRIIDNGNLLEEVHKFTWSDIVDMFPRNWKYLKHLKKNKILCVIVSDHFTNQCNLRLTSEEVDQIDQHIKSTRGTFISSFDNEKDVGLVLVNSNLPFVELRIDLMHELVYFLQWDTGKKIKDFLGSQAFEIDDSLKEEVIKTLGISSFPEVSREELEAYANTIFYDIKMFFEENGSVLVHSYLAEIIRIAENRSKETSFPRYYAKVRSSLEKLSSSLGIRLVGLLNVSSFSYLLAIGFFRVGFTALKNHMFRLLREREEGRTPLRASFLLLFLSRSFL